MMSATTWLRSLRPAVRQASQSASKSANKATRKATEFEPSRWERSLGRLASSLNYDDNESTTNKRLADSLRRVLNSQMQRHSSDLSLSTHFSDLFAGLDTLTDLPDRPKAEDVLAAGNNESAILRRFDKIYYQSRLTYKLASSVLADQRVQDVDHVLSKVNSGGTLIRWDTTDRQFFDLHAANKYWQLGEREKAKQMVAQALDAVWTERLQENRVPWQRAEFLVRAVAATNPERIERLAENVVAAQQWHYLYLLWSQCLTMQRWNTAEIVARLGARNPLFDALNLAGNVAKESNSLDKIRKLLGLKLNRNTADTVLSGALLDFAKTNPDFGKHIVDLLDQVNKTEVIDARVEAFRISLN